MRCDKKECGKCLNFLKNYSKTHTVTSATQNTQPCRKQLSHYAFRFLKQFLEVFFISSYTVTASLMS